MVKTNSELKSPSPKSSTELLEKVTLFKKDASFTFELVKSAEDYFVKRKFFRKNRSIISENGPFPSLEEAKADLSNLCEENKKKGYKSQAPKQVFFKKAKSEQPEKKSFKLIEDFFNNKDSLEKYLQSRSYDYCCHAITKITQEDIEEAYSILYEIEQSLLNRTPAKVQGLSQRFYSKVPHFLSEMKSSEIDTFKKLTQKCETLAEIEHFQFLYQPNISFDSVFKPAQDPEIRKLINLNITSATGLLPESPSLQIEEIFEVVSTTSASIRSNHLFLWLKINPYCIPHIVFNNFKYLPATSPRIQFEYNKALYFYDNISQLLPESGETVLALCDVALGNTAEKVFPDFNFNDPNFDSVKGLGRVFASQFTPFNNVLMPAEFTIGEEGFYFPFTIYSVYDVGQVLLKFIVKGSV